MRKNKLSTAGLAAILSVALMSGGIFAWFANKDTTAQVDVSTGEIIIDLDNFVPAKNEILPGGSVELQLESGTNAKMHNKGSKAAVIELDLSQEKLKAVLPADFNPAEANDWLPEYDTVYALETVEINGQNEERYVYSAERLAEIAHLSMDTNTEKGWTTVASTGKYYTVLEPAEDLELKGLRLNLSQELGGNVGPFGGEKSPSRQFEQATQFLIDITAMGTQATAGAVTELYGAGVVEALETNGFSIPE